MHLDGYTTMFFFKYPQLSATHLPLNTITNEEYTEVQQTDIIVQDSTQEHDLEHDIECSQDIFRSDSNERVIGYHGLLEVF